MRLKNSSRRTNGYIDNYNSMHGTTAFTHRGMGCACGKYHPPRGGDNRPPPMVPASAEHKEVITVKDKIRKYFKDNGLPSPGAINKIGAWAHGECYAVTTGWIRLKRFCVYCVGDQIHSVRARG